MMIARVASQGRSKPYLVGADADQFRTFLEADLAHEPRRSHSLLLNS